MSLPLYFVEVRGRRGNRWFIEINRDDNSAGAIRCLIRHDSSVIKVLEVCEDEGTCRDVTEDMRREALAGVVPEPIERDHLTERWDYQRDLRKHDTVPA